jgi:NitT/TauT family transport system substrate-binding protein
MAATLQSAFPQAQDGRTIVVAGLKGPSGIGMVKMFDAPPEIPGAKFAMTAVGSADLVAAKVISGEFDAAILPVNVAAKLYASRIPILLAAITGNGMVSLLTTDSSIHALSDLRGHEVHVAGQGATPDFVFRSILRKNGMDPEKDLRLNYSLPYPEAALALAAGKIRIAILPEPFATMARSANREILSPLDMDFLWKTTTGQASYPMTAFVVSKRFATQMPQAAKALLASYRDSIAWVRSNPAAAGLLVEKHELGLKASVATKAIPRSNYVFQTAREARPAIEALLSTFLALAPASIGGSLPDGAFYAEF